MKSFLRQSWAFFYRDFLESISYPVQLLIDLSVLLANGLAFFFIAKLIDPQKLTYFQSYSGGYFPYVFLGIAVSGFQSTALQSFSKAVQKEQGAGTLEAILISGTSLSIVVFSNFLWTSLATLLRLCLYLLAGALLFEVDLSQINLLSFTLSSLLLLFSLAGFGLISAGIVLVFKRGDPLSFILQGTSRILSGVYFPASLLPSWLSFLGRLLPLTYGLDAMRQSVLQGKGLLDLSAPLWTLTAFSLFLLPCGILFFKFAIHQTRRDGSLLSY